LYSPKIPERLIPPLYQLAKARRQPMTRMVAEILDAYLQSQGTSAEASQPSGHRRSSVEAVNGRPAA
jgi:hypothetical protein